MSRSENIKLIDELEFHANASLEIAAKLRKALQQPEGRSTVLPSTRKGLGSVQMVELKNKRRRTFKKSA